MGALLGAALYVAARRADLGVVIPEVAAAAGVDARVVGLQYRCGSTRDSARGSTRGGLCCPSIPPTPPPTHSDPHIQCMRERRMLSQALGIIPPRANLRSLVLRYAAGVVSRFYPPLEAPVSAAGPRGMAPEAADLGPPGPSAAAGAPPGSTSSLRGHYFVQPALQLAEVVMRLRIDETRTINTQAAAILQLVAESFPPQQTGAGVAGGKRPPAVKVPQDVLLAIAGANKKQVQLCKKAVAEQLLELAHKLPIGASLTRGNMLCYLTTLLSFVTTLVALKKTIAGVPPVASRPQEQQQEPGLAGSSQHDEPVAAAEADDAGQTLGGDGETPPAGKRRQIRLGDGRGAESAGHYRSPDGKARQVDPVSGSMGSEMPPQQQGVNDPVPAMPPTGPMQMPSQGEEDDARVVLGLMTMEEVRRERQQQSSEGRREQPVTAAVTVSEAPPRAGTG